MKESGFILPSPMLLYGAGAALIVIVGLSIAVKVKTSRLAAVKAEYSEFKAGVKALGEVAKKEKEIKEKKDAETIKTALAARNTAIAKLRLSTSVSAVPFLPPATAGIDRICFKRTDFDAGTAILEGIAQKGDTAIINGRAWLDSWPK